MKASNRRRQKLAFGTKFEELSKEEAERALLQLSASSSSSLVRLRYANVIYRLKIRLPLVEMNILRDCFLQSSLQLTSHFILSQSISLSNLLCFRFTLSCTSSMSLPLTHSQNTFPVRTYSFQRLSCSLGLIISITHFSFHVFLSNVLKKLNTEYLDVVFGH
jgi:hypothetical protein